MGTEIQWGWAFSGNSVGMEIHLFVGGFSRGIHSSVAFPDGLGSSRHLGKKENGKRRKKLRKFHFFPQCFSHPKPPGKIRVFIPEILESWAGFFPW